LTPNSPEAVTTVSLVRHYRLGRSTIPAVDGVSLTVHRGEFVALLGASGSGKSTLLNLIAGLDSPTSGAIVVEGQNLSTLDPLQLAQYRRHTVGMVFQSFNLVPTMTLQENVELPMRFAEVKRRDRRARVQEALERVGLSARFEHRPSEMSGGEQQRAALARALVNRPKVLLADEPTGNLDRRSAQAVGQLLLELHRQEQTILVVVTHSQELAKSFPQRLEMIEGRLESTEEAS